jgi:hypothetical protein
MSFTEVAAVRGVQGDPDRGVDPDRHAVEVDRLVQRLGDAARDRLGVGDRAHAGEHEPELVAAHPADRVPLGVDPAQALADLGEQAVALLVAERVVDLLEAVEVDDRHRDPELERRASSSACRSRS